MVAAAFRIDKTRDHAGPNLSSVDDAMWQPQV